VNVSFFAYSGLLNALTSFSLVVFIALKKYKSALDKRFVWFAFSVGYWGLNYYFWLSSSKADTALFFIRNAMAGAIFIPSTFTHLVFRLTETSEKYRRPIIVGNYLISLLFLLFCFSSSYISKVEGRLFFPFWPVPGLLFHFMLAHFSINIIYAHILMWTAIKRTSGLKTNQIKYIFVGTLVGFVGGSTNYLLWYGIPFPPFLNFLVTLYIITLAYAIIKYRIMDVNVAITRTTIFIFLYGIVFGVPAALVLWTREWLMSQWHSRWWYFPLGAYGVLSAIGPFVYLVLQRRAEAVLLREQKAYQQTLLQASRGMTLIKDLNRLLTLMVHILTKTIRITHARIFLWDSGDKQFICKAARGDHRKQGSNVISETAALIQYIRETKEPLILEEIRAQGPASLKLSDEVIREMEKLDAAVVVPSFVQDRLLGFVVLGDKKSKRLYTESDLDTLATLANQATLAIENCIFLSEFENQQIHFFQTAKMADLGTMASGISHQVNNRFNTIGAGAEFTSMIDLKTLRKLMEEENYSKLKPVIESLEDTMKKIRDDSMKGGEIATNLLHFSKKTEGFQAVDLDKAVQTCIRLWGCKRDLSLIDFENKVSKDLPKIRGNFSQVEEVVFNLLDNAYDATLMKQEAWKLGKLEKSEGEWKGKVSVSARPLQREDKNYLEITIQDNGIGMDAATRQQIFVPFFTSKGANKGTGLGLYVMKRIVEAHEGEIQLDSAYGVGTTFRVLFHQTKETEKKP